MKKVLKFELISNIKYLITAFGILISIFIISSIDSYRSFLKNPLRNYSPTNSVFVFTFFFIIFILGLNFSYNKKQSKADLYYSLPIDKKSLFLGKYFASVIEIVIFVFILYFTGFIIFISTNISYSFGFLILSMFLSMFAGVAAFNYILLFYYLGNNYLDAIFYVIWSFLAPIFIAVTLQSAINYDLSKIVSMFIGFGSLQASINSLIFNNDFYGSLFIITLVCFIYHFLSIFIVYFVAKKDSSDRTERIGHLHKYFIPLAYIPLMYINIFALGVFMLVVNTALYYIFSIYFNRSLKMPKHELIVFICSVVVGVTLYSLK